MWVVDGHGDSFCDLILVEDQLLPVEDDLVDNQFGFRVLGGDAHLDD